MDKRIIIGVDEVGCGAIAGPIIVAAVAAYEDWTLPGLRDSKKLSAKKREELIPTIMYHVICTSISLVTEQDIDTDYRMALWDLGQAKALSGLLCQINEYKDRIHQIIFDGDVTPMENGYSVKGLYCPNPHNVGYTDGVLMKKVKIIKEPRADDKYPVVSAASVIAKVNRDAIMTKLGYDFPSYKFAKHKGYPTVEHKALLEKLGPCIHHRRSSAPVRAVLEKRNEKRTTV